MTLTGHDRGWPVEPNWPGMPFGYRLELDADVLVVLRPDGSAVAAFGAPGADPLEVEAAAWEDAD